jgi:hypothetical protein
LIILLSMVLSCTGKENKTGSVDSIKKEAMDFSIKYAKDKFKEAKMTTGRDGIITVSDNRIDFVTLEENRIRYVINPSKVIVGLINDDDVYDAIVTILPVKGEYMQIPENLILLNSDKKLTLSRVIESEMKILGINKRIITAEIQTRARNSPLHDCSVCKEVVKYQFKTGDLVRIE